MQLRIRLIIVFPPHLPRFRDGIPHQSDWLSTAGMLPQFLCKLPLGTRFEALAYLSCHFPSGIQKGLDPFEDRRNGWRETDEDRFKAGTARIRQGRRWKQNYLRLTKGR
jgi:hypothetical protein